MHHVSRVRIAEFNENFVCGICFCYIIDATTIVECLHSFCRSCLVQYLQRDNCCPLCGQLVHKTKPLDYIRTDSSLQAVIYKMVPGLYKDEMQRRRQFYASHPDANPRPGLPDADEQRGEVDTEGQLDEDIAEPLSVCLQTACRFKYPGSTLGIPAGYKRYLLCNAYMPVSHLKKFIRLKFGLPHEHQISVFYADEDLPDYYSLTDIALLYSWRRTAPLDLFYVISQPDVVRHSSKLIWSRRHLKFSKRFSRHHSKRDVVNRRGTSAVHVNQASTSNVDCCSYKLTADENNMTSPQSDHDDCVVTPGCSTIDPANISKFRADSPRAISGSAFSVVGATSRRPPSIWRLVDDRMDKSEPEIGESAEKNAQIFSRNEDEILYSPKFFGDRRTSNEMSENCIDQRFQSMLKSTDSHFQPILSPVITPAAARTMLSSSTSGMAPSPISLTPVYSHFKKRLLISTTTETCSPSLLVASTSGRGRRTLDPLVIGRSPNVGSFIIHEDIATSMRSTVVSSTPPLTPLTIETTAVPVYTTQAAPAKIGIVISHGRAMTLQDKLQRMSSASPIIPPPHHNNHQQQQQQSSSGTVSGMKTADSSKVLFPEQFKGHTLSGQRRRKNVSNSSQRKRSSSKSTPTWRPLTSSCSAENEIENETANRLHQSTGGFDVKRPCHRKRSELQLLLQLDGGPLAASAEFRRANALRCRDNESIIEPRSFHQKHMSPIPSRPSSVTVFSPSVSVSLQKPIAPDGNVVVADPKTENRDLCDEHVKDCEMTSQCELITKERSGLFDVAL